MSHEEKVTLEIWLRFRRSRGHGRAGQATQIKQ